MTSIVTVNVSQQQAPTPATLQQTGAFVSQGATVLAPSASSLLTQYSDLTPLLTGAKAMASMAWASGVVTVTAAAPHGYTVGDTLLETISGVFPSAYNGTFIATVTGASTFTYLLPNGGATPGAVTAQGAFTPEDVGELNAMALTFFSQGGSTAVYVLELGPGNATDGANALLAYVQQNPNSSYRPGLPGFFYGYLVPRTWDGNAAFLALIATLNSTTARTYFWVTTTLGTLSLYPFPSKSVVPVVERPALGTYAQNALTAITVAAGVATGATTTPHGVSPGQWFQIAGAVPAVFNGWNLALAGTAGTSLVWAEPTASGNATAAGTLLANAYPSAGIPATEFTAAALFYRALNYQPGATNKVAPLAFQFLYGVTPFPTRGFSALLSNLQTGYAGATMPANIVGTGAEGGISDTIILWGTTGDGKPFTYWYSADYVQIGLDIVTANEVINGSNNPLNPLYYNQPGLNRLQARASNFMNSALKFGLVLFPAVQVQMDGPGLAAALDAIDNEVPGALYTERTIVNFIPFVTYSQENPGDYIKGRYAGATVIYTPQLGFDQIVYNVLISSFVN